MVVLEKALESSLDSKVIQPVNPKRNQPWILIGRIDAWAEAPILWPPDAKSSHWKRPWCWERLKPTGEGGNRGWDGWMASPMQGTWTWTNSRRWWGTGKPGMLQFMRSPRVAHNLVTEQQWQRICLQCGRLSSIPGLGKIPWRREWQPTPVFLPGEFHGQRSLASYSPGDCRESDMTEWLVYTTFHFMSHFVYQFICW